MTAGLWLYTLAELKLAVILHGAVHVGCVLMAAVGVGVGYGVGVGVGYGVGVGVGPTTLTLKRMKRLYSKQAVILPNL
jgi:hypothetical protein